MTQVPVMSQPAVVPQIPVVTPQVPVKVEVVDPQIPVVVPQIPVVAPQIPVVVPQVPVKVEVMEPQIPVVALSAGDAPLAKKPKLEGTCLSNLSVQQCKHMACLTNQVMCFVEQDPSLVVFLFICAKCLSVLLKK